MFTPLTSKTLEKAQRRLHGLQYLDRSLNLGNGASVTNLAAQTARMQAKLAAHNALVSQLNAEMAASRAELRSIERELALLSERMLNGVAGMHGKDSDEYEIVGGTRRSPKTLMTEAFNELDNLSENALANSSQTADGNERQNPFVQESLLEVPGEETQDVIDGEMPVGLNEEAIETLNEDEPVMQLSTKFMSDGIEQELLLFEGVMRSTETAKGFASSSDSSFFVVR